MLTHIYSGLLRVFLRDSLGKPLFNDTKLFRFSTKLPATGSLP